MNAAPRLLPGLFCAALALLGCKDEPKTVPTQAKADSSATNPHGEGEDKTLEVGDEAPAIELRLHDGQKVALSSLRGQQVLVYFYPKDDTPGCTIEAKGLRDGWDAIKAAGLVVYGVSTQGEASHKAFVEKYDLPFPLVVDEDGAVARAFHVPMRNDYAARQSFLIGKDGKIKQVWFEVDPKEHASTVIAAAKN